MKTASIIFLAMSTQLLINCWYYKTIDKIDISNHLPNELTFCGSTIDSSSFEYIELKDWFKNNTSGWERSFASFVVGNVYESDSIYINVTDYLVIVSFKNNIPESEQIVHTKDQKSLRHSCNMNNQ